MKYAALCEILHTTDGEGLVSITLTNESAEELVKSAQGYLPRTLEAPVERDPCYLGKVWGVEVYKELA